MAWYSQNNPQWASQRLGTCDGISIGSDGCYVTAFANMASDCGHDITPAQLDDIFTNNGFYDNGCLCEDNMLTKVFSDIQYIGSQSYPGPADLSQLNNDVRVKQIVEIDANLATPQVDTHFMYFYDYVDGIVRVIDSWTGLLINLAEVYGNPVECIVKIVTYSFNNTEATVTPPPPADPAPVIAPPHAEPAPVTEPAQVPQPQTTEITPPTDTTPSQPDSQAVDVQPPADVPTDPATIEPETDPTPSAVPETPVPAKSSLVLGEPQTPLVVVDLPLPDTNITTTENQAIITSGKPMNKFLSRKFLLTVLVQAVGIGGLVAHYLSSGVAFSWMGLATLVYVYVQGQIDHKQVQ